MAAARVLKGITQRQLAELVGTREIEISRIETGRCEPHRPARAPV
jgi:transcriptional regulator with XRE-family HTH domain